MEPKNQERSLSEEVWEVYVSYFPPSPSVLSQPPQHREELPQPVPLLTLVGNDQHDFDLEQQMMLHEQLLLQPQNSQQQENKRPQHKIKKWEEELIVTYEVQESNVLTLDNWAWRKYYQKPMKGSPYPRFYYRCNSHVGCTARKVVERNASDDKVFKVTYHGVHMHHNGRRAITFVGAEEMGFAPSFNSGPSHAGGTRTSK